VHGRVEDRTGIDVGSVDNIELQFGMSLVMLSEICCGGCTLVILAIFSVAYDCGACWPDAFRATLPRVSVCRSVALVDLKALESVL
jgi:hypothetical protein